MDYIKFFNENCQLCGSQRCSGSDEEINECGKNPESDYAKINARIAKWPNWKKQVYNDNSAIGAHSKKLIIGDENMSSNIGGIGFTNMGAIGGSGSIPAVVVNPTSNRSDSNCKDCMHKGICKYVNYYAGLAETVNQISVDSNFELHLRCKSYKSNTGIKG